MGRLGCLRGVGILTGFGLAVEVGDWYRFTGATIYQQPSSGRPWWTRACDLELSEMSPRGWGSAQPPPVPQDPLLRRPDWSPSHATACGLGQLPGCLRLYEPIAA